MYTEVPGGGMRWPVHNRYCTEPETVFPSPSDLITKKERVSVSRIVIQKQYACHYTNTDSKAYC